VFHIRFVERSNAIETGMATLVSMLYIDCQSFAQLTDENICFVTLLCRKIDYQFKSRHKVLAFKQEILVDERIELTSI
jgi:hypothetical protein